MNSSAYFRYNEMAGCGKLRVECSGTKYATSEEERRSTVRRDGICSCKCTTQRLIQTRSRTVDLTRPNHHRQHSTQPRAVFSTLRTCGQRPPPGVMPTIHATLGNGGSQVCELPTKTPPSVCAEAGHLAHRPYCTMRIIKRAYQCVRN